MFITKGSLLNCLRIFVALLCCVSVTSAQTGCVLKDPGPRPAGNNILYFVQTPMATSFQISRSNLKIEASTLPATSCPT